MQNTPPMNKAITPVQASTYRITSGIVSNPSVTPDQSSTWVAVRPACPLRRFDFGKRMTVPLAPIRAHVIASQLRSPTLTREHDSRALFLEDRGHVFCYYFVDGDGHCILLHITAVLYQVQTCTQSYRQPFHTCCIRQPVVPMDGIRGRWIGSMDGGAMGQMRGEQMAGMS